MSGAVGHIFINEPWGWGRGRHAVVRGLLAGARRGLRALARPTGGMPGL